MAKEDTVYDSFVPVPESVKEEKPKKRGRKGKRKGGKLAVDKAEKQKVTTAKLKQYERELRDYVRKDGGLRKGLPEDQIKRANQLCKLLKRVDEQGNPIYRWDTELLTMQEDGRWTGNL